MFRETRLLNRYDARIGMMLMVVAAVASAAVGDVPVYQKKPSGRFLKSWALCGPFPSLLTAETATKLIASPGFETDYLAGHGGENNPHITEGQIESFQGGSATWKRYDSPEDIVSLDEAVSTQDHVLAYAYCEVVSPAATPCILSVGSNDGVRVWWNGRLMVNRPGPRGLREDQDQVPIGMREGRNTLLLKIEERGNRWQFCCRLLPLKPWVRANPRRLFEVGTRPDGVPVLRLPFAESFADFFTRTPSLEVATREEPDRILWSGPWSGHEDMPLPVNKDFYEEYILRIAAAFGRGKQLATSIPFTGGKRMEYDLFADGRTEYAIVLGPDASDSERWAAQELQHWLKEVSGADFPISEPSAAQGERVIVIGWNDRSQRLLGDQVIRPEDGDESFQYRNVGPAIVILGGRGRGSMYGVFTFLERELGCRWYTRSVSVIPKKPTYRFHHLRHKESPGLRVRNDFYFEAFDPIWAARNKVNGAMGYREQPGGVECYWGVHTFYPLVPPAEFFEAHPEYYSLIDGKRTSDHAQLCLTNPDVLRIATERMRKTMQDNPQYLIYCLSQNDWANPCQCEACQAIVKEEGSESGPVVRFVNRVAEQLEKEFPDKFIGTLAYQYTRKPPKVTKPRNNVVIRLCSIECCFAHDFYGCPKNASFVEDIQGWARIAPHMYIWDYVVNFSHYVMPYPNFRVLQANLRCFRDNHAIGVMEQAAYQSRGGEFAELRAYALAKLLWNPEENVEDVINDFMYGYYGRSGQFVRKYFDLLHNRLTPDTHIGLGLLPDDPLFTDDFVREAEAIFDQAEVVADNESIRQRVEMARLPIMYLKCKRMAAEAKRDGTYARFTAIADREGVTHYAEAGAPHREAFHAEMQAVPE